MSYFFFISVILYEKRFKLNDDENIEEQYEMANSEDCWNEFKDRYLKQKPEIALEVSTSGKYVTGLLRDMPLSPHG